MKRNQPMSKLEQATLHRLYSMREELLSGAT